MRISGLAGIALFVATGVANAQTAPIPVVPVRVVAESEQSFALQPYVRGLPNGRVLLGDQRGVRILVFDSTLKTYTVSADSAGKSGVFLQSTLRKFIPYVGDSTVMVDVVNRSFLSIGPDGKIGRPFAHVNYTEMMHLNTGYQFNPGFDSLGRFIYRTRMKADSTKDSVRKSTRDTINIVRADFNTRKVDTIADFTAPKSGGPEIETRVVGPGQHRAGTKTVTPLLESPDGWAVMTDGSLAILRQHDYHVDWVAPNGTKTSSPKLPFDWKPLTEANKRARIDSMKRIIDSLDATPTPFSRTIIPMIGEDGRRMQHPGGRFRMDTIPLTVAFVPLYQIPDYVPPVGPAGGVMPDMDNNLWILPTTTSIAGDGLLYDVVNRKGELYQRVRAPKDCVILGFGRGGVVLLGKYNGVTKSWTVVRGRV